MPNPNHHSKQNNTGGVVDAAYRYLHIPGFVFADAAEMATCTTMREGDIGYLSDTDVYYKTDGVTWVEIGNGMNSTSIKYNATVTTATPYAVTATDAFIYVNATAGNKIVQLPAATGSGRVLTIKKIDATAYTVTVTANGAETIDLAPTQIISYPQVSFSLQDYAAGLWAIH
jgi:VCBS repeat-containing protein